MNPEMNLTTESIEKQWLVKQIELPYDMNYEISSFLFLSHIQQQKKNLNDFIVKNIIRYEQYHFSMCNWNVFFNYYNTPQFQHMNCLKCGNFIIRNDQEFYTQNQCCQCQET